MELANEGIPEKILPEFKKVGSNFKILDRTVLFEPRGAWKTLLDSGFGGGSAHSSALRADQISDGNSDFEFWRSVWDEVGTFILHKTESRDHSHDHGINRG